MKGIFKGFLAGMLALGAFLYIFHLLENIKSAELFSDITHAAPILAQIFGFTGLAWMVVYSIISDGSSKIKLIGSGLVLSLAFASNNVWTYALSIFIVATLVTELQFLEKLAAMFTNRDKYWDYLTKHSTPEQSEQKAILEAINAQEESLHTENSVKAKDDQSKASKGSSAAEQDLDGGQKKSNTEQFSNAKASLQDDISKGFPATIASRAKEILKFEKQALDALKIYSKRFKNASLQENMRFSARGFELEVDAILSTTIVDYVVEVTNSRSAPSLVKNQLKLKELVSKYTLLLEMAGKGKRVSGILILPQGVWHPDYPSMGLMVLELDAQSGKLRKVSESWSWEIV